jgi:hypothetical protein
MTEKRSLLLMIARSGMELCWLCGWCAYLSAAVLKRGFPLPEAVCAFFLAALIMRIRWVGLGRWRIFFIPTLHLSGFLLAAAIIVYPFTDGQIPFINVGWAAALLQQTEGFMGWVELVLMGCFVLVFWIGGCAFARRPTTAVSVGRRFDAGITVFLGLFVLRFLLAYKGSIHVGDPYSGMLIVPFFIFSLLAIGIVNQRSSTPKAFLSGFHWIGVISSFTIVAVCLVAAGFFFLLPFFTVAAEAGYSALKTATGPLGPVMVSFLRFIFQPRSLRMDPPSPSLQPDNGAMARAVDTDASDPFIQSLIVWGIAGLAGLLLLFGVCIGLWYLWRWLWHKFSQTPEYEPRPGTFIKTLLQLLFRLIGMAKRLQGYFSGYSSVIQLFESVMGWGRRSGIPRLAGETPLEYSRRLASLFPLLHRQFGIIVEAYHKEVYAKSSLDIETFRAAQMAWRDLRSPRYWPMRIRAGFYGGYRHLFCNAAIQ